jgi:prepilin-type N-terminal cleavage/methylation domain-containing protein
MRQSRGFTLIELLVAASLVGLLAVTVLGAFTVGHRSVKGMAEGLDANQQLRAAVKMMTDDLAFAKWVSGGDPSFVNCYMADGYYLLNDVCEFKVLAYQPTSSRLDPYWNDFPTWPGDLVSAPFVRLRYRLLNGDLIREIYDDSDSSRVYSSRVLLSGLEPYDGPENGSHFEQRGAGLVYVVLRMPVTAGGRTDVAQVSTIFYMR